jgi:hypothetical protein
MFMYVLSRLNSRTHWDYRDYCDHRSRLKRRLRLRMSIGVTLLICVLLGLAWAWTLNTGSMQVAAGATQPIKSDKQLHQKKSPDQK